jgi:hypothetical protein
MRIIRNFVNTGDISMNEIKLTFHFILKVVGEDQGLDLSKVELQMLGTAKKVCQHP